MNRATEAFSNTLPPANLQVYFTYDNNLGGVSGVAWLGTACDTSRNERVSINEYFYDAAQTGQTVAHEIGHNLNMQHDFISNSDQTTSDRFCDIGGTKCTGLGGVMDYYQKNYTRWSCCSQSDFKKLYDSTNPFCLSVTSKLNVVTT